MEASAEAEKKSISAIMQYNNAAWWPTLWCPIRMLLYHEAPDLALTNKTRQHKYCYLRFNFWYLPDWAGPFVLKISVALIPLTSYCTITNCLCHWNTNIIYCLPNQRWFMYSKYLNHILSISHDLELDFPMGVAVVIL